MPDFAMKRFLPPVICLVLTLAWCGDSTGQTAPSPTPAIQTGGETAAKAASDIWLAQVDDGRYDAGYLASASVFQKLVTKEQWVKLATAGRKPMGKIVTRSMKDSKFSTTMAGAPEGQYVVLHYDTAFEKRPVAVETVTTLLDSDGQWKVCGYFIR